MVDLALRNEVIQRLLVASDSKVSAAEVDDKTSFQDLDISSLILVTLAAELEDQLGIDIDNDDLSSVRTIGDLFKAIENSQQRSPRV
jgi:acyl carrier protein